MQLNGVLCVLAIASAGGSAFANPTPVRDLFKTELIVRPAFNAEWQPDWAVDHVAIKEVKPQNGPAPFERVMHTRSGTRYKEQLIDFAERGPSFTDLNTKTHVSYTSTKGGSYKYISISRPEPTGDYETYRRKRTGERDRALGETCDVWSTKRVSKRSDSLESDWLTCFTRDGIALWTKVKSTGPGTENWPIKDYSRTVSIERRKVERHEVFPPIDLLDRSKWAGMDSGASWSDPLPSHEAVLEGTETDMDLNPQKVTWTVREHGPWSYRLTTKHDGERRWGIKNRSTGWKVQARQLGNGSLHSISISSHDQPLPRANMIGTGSKKTIAGEECEVMRPPRSDPHGNPLYCRTSDGVLLMHSYLNSRYGDGEELEATAIRRGDVAPADLMVPPIFLEPKEWKIWPTPASKALRRKR